MASSIKKRKAPRNDSQAASKTSSASKTTSTTSSSANLKETPQKVKRKDGKKFITYFQGQGYLLIVLAFVFGVIFATGIIIVYTKFGSLLILYSNIYKKINGRGVIVSDLDTDKLILRRGIDRRFNLSLDEFIELYDAKWPVLITDVMKNWKAMKKWTKDFFIHNYGTKRVAFKGVEGNINNRQGLATNLAVYLQHLHESSPDSWTYLEDEVFLMRNAKLLEDLGVPMYLKEDFFSLFPEDVRPWNSMMLWGTKFSRSSLHIDPYNWTGTNAVIKGRKQWKLYPPGQDHLLYVTLGRRCGFPLDCWKYQSDADAFSGDKQYPSLKKAKVIEFEQLPGEMLIIPTGWFHQAYNSEETLAVSSQVMNSQNYKQVLEEIIKVGNIRAKDVPSDLESLSPKDQVERIMSLIPKRIIERGKKVNKDIIQQMDKAF